ncbi:MAG TPA: hypothetical protein VJ695_10285 [Nitrososphaera sp.]|nr:hypothetical protein [Nitrososphaera sp.]
MAYVSDDKNYTDPNNSGVVVDTRSGSNRRVGDNTGEPPTNQAIDRDKAAKMANLLEDLKFPASKEDIKNHVNRKSPAMGNRINDIFEAVWNNLRDDVTYNSVYEVEKAAGLVERTNDK